jgi:hypothetical protein
MPFPFDATLKEIVRQRPADFAAAFGLPPNPTRVLNVDLSTLSAATDAALGYGDPLREIIDLNFQSGHDLLVPARVLLYRSAFHYRHRVPVRSIVVLLRPAADHDGLNGELRFGAGTNRVECHYEVIRLWQVPMTQLLEGPLGAMPLAALCQLPGAVSVEEELAAVVRRMDERVRAETGFGEASMLMTGAYILSGLRVRRETLAEIFRGVGVMQESSAYQLILDEGDVRGLRRTIRNLGAARFGAPDPTTEATLNAITDLARLDRMSLALLHATTWTELLAIH